MKVEGLAGISRMGDVLVREVTPASFVETKDAGGKVLAVEQATAPVVQAWDMAPAKFPWLPVLAAAGLVLVLVRRPKRSTYHRRRR
jgi:hypothetical protein